MSLRNNPRKALGLLLLVPMLSGFVITSSTSANAQTPDVVDAELAVVDQVGAAVAGGGNDLDEAVAKLDKKDKATYDKAKGRAEALLAAMAAAEDPAAAYAALSKRDQKLYDRMVAQVGITTTSDKDRTAASPSSGPGDGGLSIMSTGCWYLTDYNAGLNAFGQHTWRAYMEIYTCFNSDGRVNSNSHIRRTWGQVHMPGWTWDPSVNNKSQRFGAITHKAIYQTRFYLGAGSWAAIKNEYPCLRLTTQGTSGAPLGYKSGSCTF